MKKQFLILFAFISVLALSQVPQRFNKVIVTGDITSPKFIKTGSNADSVLLGNGSARAISTVKTDTVSLSNRINAKATGNGTANGTNTGDETLTSIKTKLGAASAVSDGYLKYQDFVKFDGKLSSEVDGSTTNELQTISTNGAAGNIALSNSGGTLNLNVNDADASPTNEIQDLSLSGNMLTLSSDDPVDISQAAAVQANTAKVSNATHTGDVTGSTALTLATVNASVGTYNNVTINAKGLATAGSNVNYSTDIHWNITALNAVSNTNTGDETLTSIKTKLGAATAVSDGYLKYQDWNTFNSKEPAIAKNTAFNKNFGTTPGTVLEGRTFGTAANSAVGDFQPTITGLTTNYIPKWNGSSFVNSLISDDGANTVYQKGLRFSFSGGVNNILYAGGVGGVFQVNNQADNLSLFSITNTGLVSIPSTTTSTSPTTGALDVGGGIGADHVRANQFYGSGSNLTGVQLPITLTTNGTSGAATFSGNVLNVPNYTSSGGVDQTQTIVNGSTGGSMTCSMPFQTGAYKKVMIRFSNLYGNASYSYPTLFTVQPSISEIYQQSGTPGTYIQGFGGAKAFTITGASGLSGWIFIEGY